MIDLLVYLCSHPNGQLLTPVHSNLKIIKCGTALPKLANFCNSYKQNEIDDLASKFVRLNVAPVR